jgi:hypothetical protein
MMMVMMMMMMMMMMMISTLPIAQDTSRDQIRNFL